MVDWYIVGGPQSHKHGRQRHCVQRKTEVASYPIQMGFPKAKGRHHCVVMDDRGRLIYCGRAPEHSGRCNVPRPDIKSIIIDENRMAKQSKHDKMDFGRSPFLYKPRGFSRRPTTELRNLFW